MAIIINFFNIYSVSGNTSSKTDRTVTAFQARYVRVIVTNGIQANPQLASILEFEVYDAAHLPPHGVSIWNHEKISRS